MNLLITGAWQGAKEHIEEIGFLGNSIKFQPQNKNVTENSLLFGLV